MTTYLPCYCASCGHASLVDEQSDPVCAFCEAAASIIPGAVYGDDDWLAFAEIDRAVARAALHGVQASALADELQELMLAEVEPRAIAEHMLRRLPALLGARLALMSLASRGLNILTTALSARARDLALIPGEYPTNLLGPSSYLPGKYAGAN